MRKSCMEYRRFIAGSRLLIVKKLFLCSVEFI